MQIRVVTFGELTEILGKEFEVSLREGADLSVLMLLLEEKSGSQRGRLGEYRIAHDIAVLVNGKSIHLLQGFKTTLREGDSVYLLLPFAGG